MSLALYAKAVQVVTKASAAAVVAVEKYGKQKVKYEAYLDNIRKLVSVTGTGGGYINNLAFFYEKQKAAFAKGDFAAGFYWQKQINDLLPQMNKWLLAMGMPFNFSDFKTYMDRGGNPESAFGSASGTGPKSGSGLTTGSLSSTFTGGTSNGTLP